MVRCHCKYLIPPSESPFSTETHSYVTLRQIPATASHVDTEARAQSRTVIDACRKEWSADVIRWRHLLSFPVNKVLKCTREERSKVHSEEVGGGTTISGASVFNQCLCRSNARRESLVCFMKTRTGSQRQKPGGYVIKAVLKNFLSPITFFFFADEPTCDLLYWFHSTRCQWWEIDPSHADNPLHLSGRWPYPGFSLCDPV